MSLSRSTRPPRLCRTSLHRSPSPKRPSRLPWQRKRLHGRPNSQNRP